MKTILSLYEKSETIKKDKPSVYSRQDVVTKQQSLLIADAQTIGRSKSLDLAKLESSYDLDQYDKYLS
jgi:hypothetical protein